LAHHRKFGGLGRTIAEAALAAGDQVLATAREPALLEDLVHRFGSRIHTVQQDVRNGSAAATAVQIAVDVFGRIDVSSSVYPHFFSLVAFIVFTNSVRMTGDSDLTVAALL
jgi:NAD(P)-dependent dehydrogenase (short-subunit alcohol dehydrogenase family)